MASWRAWPSSRRARCVARRLFIAPVRRVTWHDGLLASNDPKGDDRSVEAVRVDHFEQLVVVAVVDVNPDEYRAIAVIQGVLQDRRDLLG